jgi:hypothetical protein
VTAPIAIVVAYFFLCLLSNRLSIAWLQARDDQNALRAANIDALKEVIDWVPIVSFVIYQEWYMIVAGVVAAWTGSYCGLKKAGPKQGHLPRYGNDWVQPEEGKPGRKG